MSKTVSKFMETSRTRARAIKARNEEMGSKITLGQAYEMLAAADGFRNWATMKATMDVVDARPQASSETGYATGDHCVSFRMTRRTSIDAEVGEGEDDLSILNGARIQMSYHFFDGEEHPPMRFREMAHMDADRYAVVVDIEMPEWKQGHDLDEYAAVRMTMAAKENVLAWGRVPYPDREVDHNLVFNGSGRGARNVSWVDPSPSSSAAPAMR